MSTLSIIVAAADNGVIGNSENDHLWTLPADVAYFRNKTVGHTVIMGRKTFEALGRSLPDRRCFVVTNNGMYQAPGCEVVNSLSQAIKRTESAGEVFIIGGGEIYRQALPDVEKIYLTRVHMSPDGNVFFKFDQAGWREISREDHKADERNECDYSFIELVRNRLDD